MRFDGDAQVRQLRYTGRHRKGHGQVLAFRARGRDNSPLVVATSPDSVSVPHAGGELTAPDAIAPEAIAPELAAPEPTAPAPTVPEADQPPASASASRAS